MKWVEDARYDELRPLALRHQQISDASETLRADLRSLRSRRGDITVDEALQRLSAPARRQALLKPWLDARARELATHRGQPRAVDTLTAEARHEVVLSWMREHGLEELIHSPVGRLPGAEELALLNRERWHYDNLPAAYLFLRPAQTKRAAAVRGAILDLMLAEVCRAVGPTARAFRARVDAAVQAGPPREPGFREFWPQLVAAYERMVVQIGAAVPPRGLRLAWNAEQRFARLDHNAVVRSLGACVDDLRPGTVACRYALDLYQHLILLVAESDHPGRAAFAKAFGAPTWVRRLERVDRMVAVEHFDPADDKNTLVWRVLEDGVHGLVLRPERARLNKAGTRWITRIEDAEALPVRMAAEPVDAEVLQALRDKPSASRDLRVLRRLVGHPRVLGPGRDNRPFPVRAVRAALRLRKDGSEVALRVRHGEAEMSPAEANEALERAARDGHWAVLRADGLDLAELRLGGLQLLRALGSLPEQLPDDALPELLRRVASWSALIGVEVDDSIPMTLVEGDRRPVVQVEGDLQAARIRVFMRHLPDAAVAAPGAGAAQLYGMQGDRPVKVERDLDAERAAVRATWKGVPVEDAEAVEPWTWQVQGPARVLEVLQALKERDGVFRVGWTDRLPVLRKPVDAKSMTLRVSSGRDWFGIGGTVQVDGQTAELDDVLAADEATPGFLRLKDGSWAALTRELAEAIRTTADASQGEGAHRRITPLHTGLIEDLASAGVTVDAPADWLAVRDRVEEARRLDAPLPDGLKADLRPYQRDGFRWLASLAHWAPGAVLADDMGLGKTVQAIGLLLRRAADGPALVVVPTSLGFNWVQELERFAPSLRPVWFHGTDRTLRDPAPGEVWITTWGVLALDADRLAEPTWRTLIFDEAHAIKNPDTRRAKAARRLKADFRLALTGTPLENHLGELWSLFDAILPGLLGARTAFHERFRLPIEQRGDTRRRKVLSRLIQPFLLRRTKGNVARDLPDRIEIIHRVARSGAERSLYDEARRNALAALADGGGANKGRFKILAALQQLRQLACHPALVDPGSPVASSKLHHVCRLAADLKAQGHRMLVFSQFTSHLDLVQPALGAKGLSVLRLDGSTPAKQRERLVDAFQAGEADAFLISLKAGGVGLNLTAATYVLHLDPWWNPASEDQATDRAHRIGQTEAVTVIRVVAQGTIEEQILSMHEDKRALAAEVLSGTGDTRRLDVEALRGLLTADPEAIEVGEDDGEDEGEVGERSVEEVVIADAFGEGADPAASAGRPAAARAAGGEGEWLSGFVRSLEREREAGRITAPTLEMYTRTAMNLEAWHGEALPRDAEALTALRVRYVEAIERGEVPHRTDRHNAATVVRRMVRWLGDVKG